MRTSSKGKASVVLTDGVFDLIHANHLSLLMEASTYGEKLIVAVVSDAQAESFKRRPVICESDRLEMVKAIGCVDEAFILRDPLVSETMEELMQKYDLSAVVYSGNATADFYVPAEKAGIMHRLKYRPGICSTSIIERIVERFGHGT